MYVLDGAFLSSVLHLVKAVLRCATRISRVPRLATTGLPKVADQANLASRKHTRSTRLLLVPSHLGRLTAASRGSARLSAPFSESTNPFDLVRHHHLGSRGSKPNASTNPRKHRTPLDGVARGKIGTIAAL